MAGTSAVGVCFICTETLSEGDVVTVKKKGIETLSKSSVLRNLPDHTKLLKDRNEISVHRGCQVRYNHSKMIEAATRRCSHEQQEARPRTRSTQQVFNFKNHCFMCGEEVTKEFLAAQVKLPQAKRNSVITVEMARLRETVLKAAINRGDEWAQQIISRLQGTEDLIKEDAQYHLFCQRKLFKQPSPSHTRGRKRSNNVNEAMEQVFSYLDNNSEECQFSMDELINQIEGDYIPDVRTVKARLFDKYGEDVLIAENSRKKTIVCMKKVGYKVLTKHWYTQQMTDPEEEKLRIIKAAADILIGDIRSQVYNTTEYTPPDNFLKDAETVIPPTLLYLFESMVLRHKRGSLNVWKKKCIALCHAVISAVRPRSFISSLLNGVGVYLYRHFGSKLLINMMSTLGFSCSYSDASLLELSTILQPQQPATQENAFVQFVFDNADFNVNTLDGLGTFHAMGGIMVVTPCEAITPDSNVPRIAKCSTNEIVQKAGGNIDLTTYKRRHDHAGLASVAIADVNVQFSNNEIVPSGSDILWLYGKKADSIELPGWNGFMEGATQGMKYECSKIICLQFINNPPTQYDTIYTALLIAREKTTKAGQQTCFVTFDQPLYIKAQEIIRNCVNPDMKNIVVRLGGFHLLMSFMGTIGTIMAGSGLKALLTLIYAENSVEKIISGHAYSRAVRAHILVHLVLAKLIWESIDLLEDEAALMKNTIYSMDPSVIMNVEENYLWKISAKFREVMKTLESRGPTSKLWVQYFSMVTLIKQFIEAERTGNWSLHLATVQKMLPFFHAAGHFFYAKCAHLYLQDMMTLETKMDPAEYHAFTVCGKFTIRRTKKFWSGIWSDQTIEQTLMRMMKTSGGLTTGRGITDGVLTRWTLGMIHLQNICSEIETFCEITSASSEQHVDTRPSRIARDNEDAVKLSNWLSQHDPFPEIDVIMSIDSGVVGGSEVNCHLSEQIGRDMISKMMGNNFENVKFKRKDKIVSLASISGAVKFGNTSIVVDPLMLFQRLCIAKQSDDDLKAFFKFELSPFPMSLFTEEGMRKGTKSSLYTSFTPITEDSIPVGNRYFVIDGGHLLHKVVWQRQATFGAIADNYVQYLHNNYGERIAVVFDGYPDDEKKSTKNCERLRRAVHCSPEVLFQEETVLLSTKEKFLGNESNKKRFIELLMKTFKKANISVQQAAEDADLVIIKTAISIASQYVAVCVVGEDIDLLVLLTALAPTHSNLYFQKCGKGKTPDTYYSTTSFKHGFTHVLLFIHAISGCDTTSALFGQGKNKFCSLFFKYPQLVSKAASFHNPNLTTGEVAEIGESVLVALYGGNPATDHLDQLRYNTFVIAAAKTKFNLARLPPTADAAQLHTMRTYHQIQKWLGFDKNPLDWGWMQTSSGLFPKKSEKNAAPESLLQCISCTCKKGCMNACGCRKAGLHCSLICKYCNGQSCENAMLVNLDNEAEEADDAPGPVDMVDEQLGCEDIAFELATCNSMQNRTSNSEDDAGSSKRMKM